MGQDEKVANSGKNATETSISSGRGIAVSSVIIPDGARIPEGATFYEGDDDTRCRVIKQDGSRCRATRVRRYGICSGHAGIGQVATDPHTASARAAVERTRRKEARLTLGISARRAAQPLQVARVAAQRRSEDIARALIDEPLDGDFKPSERHRALSSTMALLYPQTTASVSLDVPEDVTALGWDQLQALAAAHLGDDDE